MKKDKGTKRALLGSVMVMLLCLAMLIGSTFAWFTDSAATAQNTIQTGNLDLVVQYRKVDADGNLTNWADVTTQTKLFNDSALWEPGHTEAAYLKIRNAGPLALKYKLAVNVANTASGVNEDGKTINLSEHLMFSHVEQDTEAGMPVYDRAAAQAAAGSGQSLGTYSEVVSLAPNAEKYIALAVTMPTSVGNEANYRGAKIPSIALGISLVATQDTVESDSFGTDYDANAVYPALSAPVNIKVANTIDPTIITTFSDIVVLPDGSKKTFSLEVPKQSVDRDTDAVFSVELIENTPNSTTYEISLTDTEGNTIHLNKAATVTLYLPEELEQVYVTHDGSPMEVGKEDGQYKYIKNSGKLRIYSSSFSPFKVTYKSNPEVSVDGEPYTSFTDAFNALPDGGTVVLHKDTGSLLAGMETFQPDTPKKVTVDLNGHTLGLEYFAIYNLRAVGKNADVTFKNGTIESTENGFYVGQGAKLTLDNVDLIIKDSDPESTYAITVNGVGSKVVLKNTNITSSGNGVGSFGSSGSVTIEGGTINAKTFGICQNGTNGGNTFTVTGTNIASANLGIYISNMATSERQTLTMSGCTVSGTTAVEIKHTNAAITDSTLTATAGKTSKVNSSGPCTTGYALAATSNGSGEAATGTVSVTGGSVTADNVFVFKATNITIDGIAVTPVDAYVTQG